MRTSGLQVKNTAKITLNKHRHVTRHVKDRPRDKTDTNPVLSLGI